MVRLAILAVDDEPGMRAGIERALEDHVAAIPEAETQVRFHVLTAADGQQALAALRAQPPDIMLLDYKLPDMTGLDILQALAERQADTVTIMITAHASIETAVAATRQGAYDFLPKPFTPADLRHIARKAASRLMLIRRARDLHLEKRQIRFDFIRVLGHELKAPIAAVAGYLYLMRDHALGPGLDDYATPLARSLERIRQMQKLITDLLDMTRLESGNRIRELAAVDMAAAVRSAWELVAQDAKPRGITFASDVAPGLTFRADRVEVDMMLNNLLSNAVKYNRDGGRVTLSAHRTAHGLRVAVADTGIGISAADQSRLFQEFVRIKTPQTRDILGSGLGLSILRKLAELYEGGIAVESEPGRGSTFTLTLCDAPPEPEKTPA
jgi:signal transduction histidine kinase